MGRHEIRLRRQRMTSRRIDSHKNYMDVLKEHERTTRTKRVLRLLLLLAFFLGLMSFLYYVLINTGTKSENAEGTAYSEMVISDTNQHSKNINSGKFNDAKRLFELKIYES